MKSLEYILNEALTRKYILNEGVEDVKKYYQDIDDDKFMTIIALDPTYKKDVDKVGTYGKWLLNLYRKHNLKDEDFYKVTDYLKEFEDKRKWFKNKDIQQFKSLGALAQALDEVEVGELSNNQKDKQFKRELKHTNLNAEKVFEDNEFEVWIPNDYVSSCKLASNTEWCTGPSSKGDYYYYEHYSKRGPLYILISKQDKDEKYQFHFESGQFMNRYDKPIKLLEFLDTCSESLKKFFTAKLLDTFQTIVGKDIDLSQSDDTEVEVVCDVEEMIKSPNVSDSRDALDYDTIYNIITDNAYEVFDVFAWEISDNEILDTLNYYKNEIMKHKDIVNKLSQFNFTLDDVYLSYDNASDEVWDAIDRSYYDALSVGCWKEAYNDVINDIIEAYEDVRSIKLTNVELTLDENAHPFVKCKCKIGDIKHKLLSDYIDYECYPSADDVSFSYELNQLAAEHLRCYEPRYGWSGFDVDTFVQSLEDNLYEL